MIKSKYIKWGVLVGIFCVMIGIALRPYAFDLISPSKKKLSTEKINLGKRVLVIAPHPDDETLGPGGLVQKALARRKRVKVVIVTTGDGYREAVRRNFNVEFPGPTDFRRLGLVRHQESINGAGVLGVPARDIIFLGYPDGGVNALWEWDWDYDQLHLGSNGVKKAPYDFAYEKNAPYCGDNLVKNLSSIIAEYKPTDIIYPDPYDQHHDHWAVNAFVKYVLTQDKYKVKEWFYLVHRGDFPWPWEYNPKLYLRPPYVLRDVKTQWLYSPMGYFERKRKLEAIQQYVSQKRVMDPFLQAFVRRNELYETYIEPGLPAESVGKTWPTTTLFREPAADTVWTELEAGADVTYVNAWTAGDRFNVGIQTRSPVKDNIFYNLRVRFFNPDGVKRLDFSVNNFKLGTLKLARNSMRLPEGAILNVKSNRLWITMPRTIIEKTTDLFISADTVVARRGMDKTAWRLVKVKEK